MPRIDHEQKPLARPHGCSGGGEGQVAGTAGRRRPQVLNHAAWQVTTGRQAVIEPRTAATEYLVACHLSAGGLQTANFAGKLLQCLPRIAFLRIVFLRRDFLRGHTTIRGAGGRDSGWRPSNWAGCLPLFGLSRLQTSADQCLCVE